jgi:hypothetical protein
MAVNTTPIFIDSIRCQTAALTSGASVLQTLFDAGADGSRVDKVTLVADGVTTVARFQITVNDGAAERVIYDGIIEVEADTTTNAAWQMTVTLDAFLEADDTMKVRLDATHNASTAGIDVVAYGGDF